MIGLINQFRENYNQVPNKGIKSQSGFLPTQGVLLTNEGTALTTHI